MNTVVRSVLMGSLVFALGAGLAQAESAKPGAPAGAVDPAKEAAMAAMQQYASPNEHHQMLEPLIGAWTYTLEWWMEPDGASQSMSGTATNSLIFGGRFLKQEVRGTMEGQPPFEGIGFTGYDNIRKEYVSVWLDNMGTGIMSEAGQPDPATGAITGQGDLSCPLTGQAHRPFRTAWTIVDPNHNTYENYMRTPDGAREFKAMIIRYTRAQ